MSSSRWGCPVSLLALLRVGIITAVVVVLFAGLWAEYLWADLKFRIWRHAEVAMTRLGSSDPRIDYAAHQVTGWVGVNVNWAKHAEYQLVVTFRSNPDGRLVLTCRGRPRMRFFFFVAGDMSYWSYEHVQRLTSEICSHLAPR